MKSLKESLFDDDLVSKETIKSLYLILKGKVKAVGLDNSLPFHTFFDEKTLKEWDSKYKKDYLPAPTYISKYYKYYTFLNGFFCFVFDNAYMSLEDVDKHNAIEIDSSVLEKISKKPIKITIYPTWGSRGLYLIMRVSWDSISKDGVKEQRVTLVDFNTYLSRKEFQSIFIKESLFDDDLVSREVGQQLKNIVFFDGQKVYRLRNGNHIYIPIERYDGDNILGVIDWSKVKKDLKKYKGENIDLGDYGYEKSSDRIVRNTNTIKKTEMFARLIMSIPYIEDIVWGGYSSKFKYEFMKKLNEYILPEYRVDFTFNMDSHTPRVYFDITLDHKKIYDTKGLKFEFVKL